MGLPLREVAPLVVTAIGIAVTAAWFVVSWTRQRRRRRAPLFSLFAEIDRFPGWHRFGLVGWFLVVGVVPWAMPPDSEPVFAATLVVSCFAVLAVVAACLLPVRVVVTRDEIVLRWATFERVIPRGDVARHRRLVDEDDTLSGEALDVVLRSGERIRLMRPAQFVTVRRWHEVLLHFLESTRNEVEHAARLAREPCATLLDLVSSPESARLGRLRALGDGTLGGLRGSRVPREDLFAHLASTRAPLRTRAAAAVALLGEEATPAERARIFEATLGAPPLFRDAIVRILARDDASIRASMDRLPLAPAEEHAAKVGATRESRQLHVVLAVLAICSTGIVAKPLIYPNRHVSTAAPTAETRSAGMLDGAEVNAIHGAVVAQIQLLVYGRIDGIVNERRVKAGDRVLEDDVLFTVAPEPSPPGIPAAYEMPQEVRAPFSGVIKELPEVGVHVSSGELVARVSDESTYAIEIDDDVGHDLAERCSVSLASPRRSLIGVIARSAQHDGRHRYWIKVPEIQLHDGEDAWVTCPAPSAPRVPNLTSLAP